MDSLEQLFFLSFILIHLVGLTIAQPDFLYYNCSSASNYTSGSRYRANLDSLLSSLSSNTDEYGFYNSTVGQSSDDRVNAIVLCRGDVELDICRSCVNDSARKLIQLCPNEKEAIAWYDLCMLRYSDQTIVGTWLWGPAFYKWNIYRNVSASDVVQFNDVLRTLLDSLRNTASVRPHRKFATGEAAAPSFQTIYALVQCTPDLSELQCSDCLNASVRVLPDCCDRRIGGAVYRPSCNLRYEIDHFYNDTMVDTPSSQPDPPSPQPGKDSNTTRTVIIIVVPTVIFLILMVYICICFRKRKQRKPKYKVETVEEITTLESLQYDFGTVTIATDNFSDTNKLGQGGFGAVYKGTLPNGREIAVKRLSNGSAQGEREFKNEVLLMAKLQHKNLVRLLGFCLEGTERLLIYEFMTNASLDHFIFDPIKCADLDWDRRYKIMVGIARGLLYLHEDSRLRIIHRDLKASNVLLDAEMNPKISDFGMARHFVLDETQGNTSRIVGTYGYMAPEYAMHGQFSVKSDVFSFGVLVLEIVSGKKNNCFRDGESIEDLLSYAWKTWREGTASNLIEPLLRTGSSSIREIMRCIHIGLLCVQENVADRPTMASVGLMLSSFSLTLQVPLKPAFFLHNSLDTEMPLLESTHNSVNQVTITELYPR